MTGTAGSWEDLGNLEEFAEGAIVARSVKGHDLIIIRLGQLLQCFKDECSHQPVRLSEFGEVVGGQLHCHAHGGQYDLCQGGKALCFPVLRDLTQYPTRIENNTMQVFI